MKFYVLLLTTFLIGVECALNEAQIKAAAKLIRNTCQQKMKVTSDQIEDMHKGVWNDDPQVKCFTNCAMITMKLARKDGAFDLELALPNIARLPESRIEPTKASMTNCQNAGEGLTDKCDLSYAFFKCMYFDNPENYFLP